MTLVPALAVASLFGLFLLPRRRRRGSSYAFAPVADERTESMPDVLAEDGVTIDVDDATFSAIGDALGWGYRWGGGSPRTPWADGVRGVDCSGFVQMALVRLGNLPASAPDRGAVELANGADPVLVGQQRPGDFAVYRGRHVMLVVSHPRADIGGHSHVMGASGGSSTIQGYDAGAPGYSPNARVKLFRTARYRPDFLTYARLR